MGDELWTPEAQRIIVPDGSMREIMPIAGGALVIPTFQAQNPAINGYYLGWASCTCYTGAMAAAFHRQTKMVMSGESIRRRTGDTTGGTNLAQVTGALRSGWGINLEVTYKLPWATFAKKVQGGAGAILQGWYAPIADSRFDAGNGFRGNHAMFVPPGWGTMDPLADGRHPGVYKYHGESYPPFLLKKFAGLLNLATSGYRKLGDGYVYAAFTRDLIHSYHVQFLGGRFWTYDIAQSGYIYDRDPADVSAPTGAPVGPPERHGWPGHSAKILHKVLDGKFQGKYIAIPQSQLKLQVIP